MEILIETKYAEHVGGTKFYEVNQFYNVPGKRFVVVYRWGKTSAKNGGGETKVESFADIRRCQDAARKKMAEKAKRGYDEKANPNFGLHGSGGKVESEMLRLALGKHYHDIETIDAIVTGIGANDALATTAAVGDEEVIEETPEPEIVRDADWGSW